METLDDSNEIVMSDRVCIGCQSLIPQIRIDAVPSALRCAKCEEKSTKVSRTDLSRGIDVSSTSATARNGFALSD